jgi:hypothetical protein
MTTPAPQADETTPLANHFRDWRKQVFKAYDVSEGHCKFVPCSYGVSSVIMDYEPLKFSSMRVFLATKGTVLKDTLLFTEQVLLTVLFACSAFPVWWFFNHQAVGVAEQIKVRTFLQEQEPRMREFALILTLLCIFSLAIYLAMSVGRWWTIRSAGVGGIKAAEMELVTLVSQLVTQDEQVLSSLRRYARTSLILVFFWRRKRLGPAVKPDAARVACMDLVADGLLTEQEVNQLVKWNHCLHETIWAWQTAIIAMLYKEGKIKSDPLLRTLLERCTDGRQAVQCIHTHLAVKLPVQYIHLLGLLVKMHNIVLALIMGMLFGGALKNGEIVICLQLFGRTLLLPFLFNAILLINAELSDPFDGHPTDFPGHNLSEGFEKDGASFVAAGRNMPEWMAKRNPMPV